MNALRLPSRVAIALVFSGVTAALPAHADETVHPLYRLESAEKRPAPTRAVLGADPPAALEEDRPVYSNWWFWALTAAVVGGVVVLGVAAADDGKARPPRPCAPELLRCFGDGR